MTQEAIFDVLRFQRLFEERIFAEVNHPETQIIAGAPMGLDVAQLFSTEGLAIYRGSSGRVGCEFLNFRGGAGCNRTHNHSFVIGYALMRIADNGRMTSYQIVN
jgi:hypothetical protein